MKTLIVGAGIIGSIYGWALAEAGHDVAHFARPGRAAALAGGIDLDLLDNRKGHARRFHGRYALKAVETVNPADGYELIIVPTKPYSLEETLRGLAPCTGDAAYLLLTQNWRGTAAIDNILPRERYAFGDAKAGGTFKDGSLIAALFNTIDLGQVDGQRGVPLTRSAALFQSAGIQPVVHDDILHYIWVQYAINAGLWPALVRAGGLGALLRDRETGLKSLIAVRECLLVTAARGVDLKKYSDAGMYLNDSVIGRQIAGWLLSLTFRFNESVQRSSAHALDDPREIKSSYDDLVTTGRELGQPMPVMNGFAADIERFAGSRSA